MLINEIIGKDNILKFMFAGKCRAIVYNTQPIKANISKFTYLIKKDKFTTHKWSVYHYGAYCGYVVLYPEGYVYVPDTLPKDLQQHHKVFGYYLKYLQLNKLPHHLHMLHENVCGRCGRALTDPESIQLGLGPICRGDK